MEKPTTVIMNSSLSSLDNGQTADNSSSSGGGGESIQEQISKLFEEIITLHDSTVRRKNAPRWYGQLNNIIINLNNAVTTNNSKQVTQSQKRKRAEKEEKGVEKERPKSVTSDFKWASEKPIRLNQNVQKRIEALTKQLAISDIDLSTKNSEKSSKFKPVKPVMPLQQPEVSISPMKDISNIIKTVASNSHSTDADDDNFDDDDDEFLRNLDVTNLFNCDETI